jgi:NTP pyrophosphatase (non-canonical NTP hydrolase)
MDMHTYQGYVSSTAVYPHDQAVVHPVLGLAGEAGEVAGKLSKWLRGDGELDREGLAYELGDCLWFIAAVALDLGYTLEEIAEMNVAKLQKRAAEGTIKGTGDNR